MKGQCRQKLGRALGRVKGIREGSRIALRYSQLSSADALEFPSQIQETKPLIVQTPRTQAKPLAAFEVYSL